MKRYALLAGLVGLAAFVQNASALDSTSSVDTSSDVPMSALAVPSPSKRDDEVHLRRCMAVYVAQDYRGVEPDESQPISEKDGGRRHFTYFKDISGTRHQAEAKFLEYINSKDGQAKIKNTAKQGRAREAWWTKATLADDPNCVLTMDD